MLLDQFHQFVLVGAHHFFNLFSALVEMERWHGANGASGGDIVGLVDVYFDKFGFGVFSRQLFKDGSNVFARAAPRCGELSDPKETKSVS